ncbi:MAG: isopeptide-forming domain-containing fimbrial protein [Thermoplasmatales archaeon]|nr:isopeptide-forming domain-containing fimbrial protein [Thermoplasmatales archaeon]
MIDIYVKKAVVFAIVAVFLMVASTPAISLISVEKINSESPNIIIYEQANNDGWYWKSSYPNYAPSGIPDFDQEQNQWMVIFPGPDGVLDSTPTPWPWSDDVVSSDGLRIAPGPDCRLESDPAGDDVVRWNFNGPVAIANCFWWFDSKFESPKGVPGDGIDGFSLVQDYTVGDDHLLDNVPLLIEKLAASMGLCSEGTCLIDDMQDAIDEWFVDTDLDDVFVEHTYNKTTFSFIADEIERSQDVILLLGFYDVEGADCVRKETHYVTCAGVNSASFMIAFSDPSRDVADSSGHDHNDAQYVSHDIYDVTTGCPCPDFDYKWWLPDYPSGYDYAIVEQAVVICPKPIYVEKKVWNGEKWAETTDADIGDTIRFNITVHNNYQTDLTNIGVHDTLPRCLEYTGNAEPEEPWINDNNLVWTFLDPLEQDEKIYIEFDAKAISSGENINHVKVDAYPAGGSSVSDTDTATINVVETPRPDLECEGSLMWSSKVKPGSTLTDVIYVKNVGNPISELDWIICEKPSWGTWTFNPSEGENLKPDDGKIAIQVTVVAPNEENKKYTGQVKICNKEDSTDYRIIQVSLTTPVNRNLFISQFFQFLASLVQRIPILERTLLYLPL